MKLGDTIVAPITPAGRGAIAVVRISGCDAFEIARIVFPLLRNPVETRKAIHGRYEFGDDGIALPFEAGHSYTGEETVELSVHGSSVSVASLVRACISAGARIAEPGEFTYRAFMNGRMDLTQAEGVRETIEAKTESQLRAANYHREGHLARVVRRIRDEILTALAVIEAHIDFSEELGEPDSASIIERIDESLSQLRNLLSDAARGRLVQEGLRIAIAGRPNAGKSSLLNRILGVERAIVTDTPGTTRDTIEELIDFGGIPCRLIDTAGLRDTDDPVECIGVERTKHTLETADLVWYLFDGRPGWIEEDDLAIHKLAADRLLIVAAKADLVPGPLRKGGLWVSAFTGEGISALAQWVRERSGWVESADPAVVNARQEPLLAGARDALEQARFALASGAPTDLATVGLSAAVQKLGEVTGETASEDMVARIFRDFCLGK